MSINKLAYLLSTCGKIESILMKNMITKFEKSKTLSTRHYYNLFIYFNPNEIEKKYEIIDIKHKFFNSDDHILSMALQHCNNDVLNENEMNNIYKNLIKIIKPVTNNHLISLLTIASLIKIYTKYKFKYLIIPIVINYGGGITIYHQTGIIIKLSNENEKCKFIYYEPYGKYEKKYSYKNAVGELFKCFYSMKECENADFTTYHDYLNLNTGIQSIIMEKNNENENEFNLYYNKLIDEIKLNNFISEKDLILFNKYSEEECKNAENDKTYKILPLLIYFDHINITSFDYDKKNKYYTLLNEILKYYCCYNSKTCVSITIVELYNFFKTSY